MFKIHLELMGFYQSNFVKVIVFCSLNLLNSFDAFINCEIKKMGDDEVVCFWLQRLPESAQAILSCAGSRSLEV